MKREKGIRIILAILGIILVGTGVAFNAAAALGNDPVGIVYDGIRSALNLSSEQLGMASNIVNIVLVVIIFFWERHSRYRLQVQQSVVSCFIWGLQCTLRQMSD